MRGGSASSESPDIRTCKGLSEVLISIRSLDEVERKSALSNIAENLGLNDHSPEGAEAAYQFLKNKLSVEGDFKYIDLLIENGIISDVSAFLTRVCNDYVYGDNTLIYPYVLNRNVIPPSMIHRADGDPFLLKLIATNKALLPQMFSIKTMQALIELNLEKGQGDDNYCYSKKSSVLCQTMEAYAAKAKGKDAEQLEVLFSTLLKYVQDKQRELPVSNAPKSISFSIFNDPNKFLKDVAEGLENALLKIRKTRDMEMQAAQNKSEQTRNTVVSTKPHTALWSSSVPMSMNGQSLHSVSS